MSILGMMALLAASQAYASNDITIKNRNRPDRVAIESALSANDYNAFKTAIAKAPKPDNTSEITEVVFTKLVEAHKLRQSGDKIGAEKIMDELGFKKPTGHFRGKHMTPPNLTSAQKTAWTEAHALMEQGKFDEAKVILDTAGIKPPQKNK